MSEVNKEMSMAAGVHSHMSLEKLTNRQEGGAEDSDPPMHRFFWSVAASCEGDVNAIQVLSLALLSLRSSSQGDARGRSSTLAG